MAFADTFKALSDPVRRDILTMLKNGRMSAGEIGSHFDMTGATVSYHLNILKKADLVFEEKEKNFVYYSLNTSIVEEGMSLMSFREGFGFETDLKSDVAPMWNIIKKALEIGGVTAMKDPTRGGFANAINEMASKSGVGVVLEQEAIPIKEEVHAVSEMLGIDPFEVANEGKVVMGVKADKAEAILEAIKNEKYGENAAIIGEVVEGDYVVVNTPIGGERILEAPIADPVPRVC